MKHASHNAFTMIELVFVIVVIGILSAIAIPKLAATRDDAVITKARSTISAVRAAIATERQKRVLRGAFSTPITLVDSGQANSNSKPIFDYFDGSTSTARVLEYPLTTCASGVTEGCWKRVNNTDYRYYMPDGSSYVDFNITNNRFDCKTASSNCDLLTK